jgi:hypothetical protein
MDLTIRKLLALALAAALAASAWPAVASDDVYEIPVDGSPYIGAKSAPVTIIEFIDYQ